MADALADELERDRGHVALALGDAVLAGTVELFVTVRPVPPITRAA